MPLQQKPCTYNHIELPLSTMGGSKRPKKDKEDKDKKRKKKTEEITIEDDDDEIVVVEGMQRCHCSKKLSKTVSEFSNGNTKTKTVMVEIRRGLLYCVT